MKREHDAHRHMSDTAKLRCIDVLAYEARRAAYRPPAPLPVIDAQRRVRLMWGPLHEFVTRNTQWFSDGSYI